MKAIKLAEPWKVSCVDIEKPVPKPGEALIKVVASSLPGEKMKPQPMQSYFRIRSVVESLPRIFTYKQIKEKALTEGISERSTCRYLKSLIELKYIEKQTDKYIRIKEFTDK